jgi:hypothetical protein
MEFSVMPSKEDAAKKLTKENVLKLFSAGLSDRNIIKRLLMTRCIKMPLPELKIFYGFSDFR